MFADRGYDFDKYRRLLWKRGIKPVIARRRVPHGPGLGSVRWVVERTNVWIHSFRRLRIRWEIRDDIHEAFLKLTSGAHKQAGRSTDSTREVQFPILRLRQLTDGPCFDPAAPP
ncbi:transposase [Streptomyces asoensis]|uniref:Transposase n=1 Tax=Streptomyces asoensis TaxID=249586 RepID=A0A6M4X230_9ACTN|nr:transposase [Streptomyces asoensis]